MLVYVLSSQVGSTASVDSVSYVAVLNVGVFGIGELDKHQPERSELSKDLVELDEIL